MKFEAVPKDRPNDYAAAAPDCHPQATCLPGWLTVLRALVCAAAVGSANPVGAQPNDQAFRFYEDAVARYEKHDISGAVVQLKNALQQDPKLLAAHVLLGKAQIAQGDAAGAEASFNRALQLGVNRSEIALPMARALLQLGKNQELLERLPRSAVPDSQGAELLVIRGQAYRAIGDSVAERRAYEESRDLDHRYVPAILALADLEARTGNRDGAARLTSEAMEIAPEDVGVWFVKGRLALESGDVRSAIEAFDRALAIDPGHIDSRLARVALLMDLGRLDDAGKDIQFLSTKNPHEPRGMYLRAVYSAKRGDQPAVRDAMEDLTRTIDAAPRELLQKQAPELLMLGALGHYGLGQPEKSRQYLEQYVALRPKDVGARRLLASVLISQREERAAIEHLEAAYRLAPSDPQVLALLGSAYMARGQLNVASRYLEEAMRVTGGTPDIRTTFGLNLLGRGETDLAIHELQEAFKKDPGEGRSGAALVALYIRHGRAKDAIEVAKVVVKREPANPQALNLLGVASVAAGDTKGARAAYEKALVADTSFVPARLNLARLDTADGNYAAARARLEAALKQNAKSTTAMFELALVEQAARRPAEAIRWLEKIRAMERGNVAAASRLVDLYADTKAPDKALEVGKDIVAARPDDLEALGALGHAYLAVGNAKEAQTVFARMARLAAFEPTWQTQIANYQIAAGNLEGASFSAEKALSGQPDYLPAQVILAEIDIRRGDADKAEQRARKIVKQVSTQAVGYRLLGDVAMFRKRYPQALADYRTALDKQPSTDAAMRVFVGYVGAGDVAGGIKFLDSWLRAHPSDQVARRALAEGHLRVGDLAGAQAIYEQLLKEQGEDAALLNNLANILLSRKDPKALEYAERAHSLTPTDASVQDTLGWVLVEQGQLDRGIRQLRDARLREPQNPEIRYHLASALARTGRHEEAARELEPVVKNGANFASRDNALVLWRSLASR